MIDLTQHAKYLIDPVARHALTIGATSEDENLENRLKPGPWSLKGDFEILDSYGGVEIISSTEISRPVYNVILPGLDSRDWEVIRTVKEKLVKNPDFDFFHVNMLDLDKEDFSREIRQLVAESWSDVSEDKIRLYEDALKKSVFGYGILEYLLRDDLLEEIMVLGGKRCVYVFHRKHGMCSTNISFDNDSEVVDIITKMASEVGRKIDFLNPLLDARLKDGSRVNATIQPVTPRGATLTIRKFSADPLTIVDLIKTGTMPVDFAAKLWIAVDGFGVKPANIIVSGGTSSGKTTTLNAIATFIPEGERVISIEDTLELQLDHHDHHIQMETRPQMADSLGKVDMNDCLINTLRMRPDRILVGEVRGHEAETLFTAMNTGHDGCMGTLHANDSKETITRLTNAPMSVPMIMLPALDLIIIQSRFKHPKKGYIRRIVEVSEVAGMEVGKVLLNKTYSYNVISDRLIDTGTPSRLSQVISKKTGFTGQQIQREIEKRAHVLEWLARSDRRSMSDVNAAIVQYNRDSERFMEKVYTSEDLT